MDRRMAEAERRVTLGEQNIANQRRVLENLLRDGHDTAEAERLLQASLESQDLHIEERNRLRVEFTGL